MEHKNNKTLLIFLSWCIILFNPVQAICVPRNQSDSEAPPSHPSSPKLQPPPSPASTTPISQPPPSPPQPTPVSAPVPPTPSSQESPDSSPKPELPKLQITLPEASVSVGVGVGGIGVGLKTITDPQIKALCDKTNYVPLCLSSITPFFNGKTDLISVIGMLIKASTEQTKQAIATATAMANEAKSDARKLSNFEDCKEVYDDALDNLQEAVDAIPVHDIGTLLTMVSAAVSDYGTCDDGFTGQPNPIPDGVSPMADINEHLMNMAGNILALARLIPPP
ncbi:hypothetical protein PTKIN_Ptkin09bG0009400 [Pterospermum kingtungense]